MPIDYVKKQCNGIGAQLPRDLRQLSAESLDRFAVKKRERGHRTSPHLFRCPCSAMRLFGSFGMQSHHRIKLRCAAGRQHPGQQADRGGNDFRQDHIGNRRVNR